MRSALWVLVCLGSILVGVVACDGKAVGGGGSSDDSYDSDDDGWDSGWDDDDSSSDDDDGGSGGQDDGGDFEDDFEDDFGDFDDNEFYESVQQSLVRTETERGGTSRGAATSRYRRPIVEERQRSRRPVAADRIQRVSWTGS